MHGHGSHNTPILSIIHNMSTTCFGQCCFWPSSGWIQLSKKTTQDITWHVSNYILNLLHTHTHTHTPFNSFVNEISSPLPTPTLMVILYLIIQGDSVPRGPKRYTPRDSSRQRRHFGKSIPEFGETLSSVLWCERRPVSASIMSRSGLASFPVFVYKFSSHYLNIINFIDNSLGPLATESPCISCSFSRIILSNLMMAQK